MKKLKLIYLWIVVMVTAACEIEPPMISNGLDHEYLICRMQPLLLSPQYSGERYQWSMPDAQGNDSVVATTQQHLFITTQVGRYELTFRIIDSLAPIAHTMTIVVAEEEVAYSRYITRVYEYCPAPGQFVGEIPYYETGDTEATMCMKVEEYISGTNDTPVSLGGFGGYVTFGFDHSVVNVPDSLDFKIHGNAFKASTSQSGGASEPGIVMVSMDSNGNGVPDDAWYELAGSEYYKPTTIHNYTITYYRTPTDHVATPGTGGVTDSTYIAWHDNQGGSGYIERNAFHSQDYFPQWVAQDHLTFSGTLLADNGVDSDGSGNNYLLNSYEWGYADNHPNNASLSLNSFDIDHAVDSEGNRVSLPYIDFVRVYTAINQQCGRIGETSTEIARAEDLHVADSLQ